MQAFPEAHKLLISGSFGPMFRQLPPEMQLLLLCCRYQSGAGGQDLSGIIAGGAVNWKLFIELTSKHRLFPVVHYTFKNFWDAVPTEIRDEVAVRASKNQKKMIALAGELKNLNLLFMANRVDFMGIKGPLMVQQFFGDYSSRQSLDLDILVKVPDIGKAISLLTGAGYQLKDGYFMMNPEKRPLYMKRVNHLAFFHPMKRIILELHWSVSKYFTSIKTEDLFEQAIQIEVEVLLFKTLPADIYFVELASHGVGHRFAKLFWLHDIAQIMAMPGFNPEAVVAMAEKFGCLTATRVGLALATEILGAKISENLPEYPLRNRKERFLRNQCMETIFEARQQRSGNRLCNIIATIRQRFSHQKYFFLMTDDWASKRRILLNTLIKPYVWGKNEKLPNNNMVYLMMTQIKWLKMVITGRMTRNATVKRDK